MSKITLSFILFGLSLFPLTSVNAQNNDDVPIPVINLLSVTDTVTIPSPSPNLVVFNINALVGGGNGLGLYYYDGGQWVYLLSPALNTNTQATAHGPDDGSPPNILTHGHKISRVTLSTAEHDHSTAVSDVARCRCVR